MPPRAPLIPSQEKPMFKVALFAAAAAMIATPVIPTVASAKDLCNSQIVRRQPRTP